MGPWPFFDVVFLPLPFSRPEEREMCIHVITCSSFSDRQQGRTQDFRRGGGEIRQTS